MDVKYGQMIDTITQKNRYFVEISRGCTGNCSYCVIKKAKGKLRSRTVEAILTDIGKLYDPSKKLFLVADDCGCYGLDAGSNLIELISEVDKQFPSISIDINYLSPQWFERRPDEYIKLFKDTSIDLVIIPMQSGSNIVLKKMNRHYDADKIIKIVDQIKKASPKTLMYGHFIVGFPGERIIDFLKTLSAMKHFDYPIPFNYSEMKGTPSASLPHKKSRFVILLRWYIALFFVCVGT